MVDKATKIRVNSGLSFIILMDWLLSKKPFKILAKLFAQIFWLIERKGFHLTHPIGRGYTNYFVNKLDMIRAGLCPSKTLKK